MNSLHELGIADFMEDENIDSFVDYVSDNGKVLKGYYGCYLSADMNCAKFIFHLEGDFLEENPSKKPQIIGFSNHFKSNIFWSLEVAHEQVNEDEDESSDYLSKQVVFKNPDNEYLFLSVRIIHADVVPSYMQGDIIHMQVAAFPAKVNYYRDMDSYKSDNEVTRIMGEPITIIPNTLLCFFGYECTINGEVKKVVEETIFDSNNRAKTVFRVTIDCGFGELELIHGIDLVKEAEREHIKVGAVVSTICFIQGDVAIGQYADGAVYDQENIQRLLRSCFTKDDFLRLQWALAADCLYVSGEHTIIGSEAILKHFLSTVQVELVDDDPIERYAYLATLIQPDAETAEYEVLTRCVLLACGKPDNYSQAVYATLNEQNKIQKLHIINIDQISRYKIDTNNEPIDLEKHLMGYFDSHSAPLILSELEWLEMIAKHIEQKDFGIEFYVGLDPECTLATDFLVPERAIFSGREEVFMYFKGLADSSEYLGATAKVSDEYKEIYIIVDNELGTLSLSMSEEQSIESIMLLKKL